MCEAVVELPVRGELSSCTGRVYSQRASGPWQCSHSSICPDTAAQLTQCDEALMHSKIQALKSHLKLCTQRLLGDGVKAGPVYGGAEAKHRAQSLQTAGEQEAVLRDQVGVLQREGAELRSRIAFLEEDNQAKREQLQEMREKLQNFEDPCQSGNFIQNPACDSWGSMRQLCLPEGRAALAQPALQEALESLRLKERECVELRAELEAMELECHSCQSRLKQCREELRQLSTRRAERRWSSWLGVAMLLLLGVAALLAVCVLHPPLNGSLKLWFRALLQGLQLYLRLMASPQYSGCFRPI
ncbi:hypothetical protein AGOR_G00141270 [Albula goreensis]|uniref:Uncharacterized protein n=1 Tax=Albula goreensis TaxID=1534307 RepID=A0A8T3DAR7_9TELE|nr:hypothetical protein AGOR_G00141270 [Albula goreensis]